MSSTYGFAEKAELYFQTIKKKNMLNLEKKWSKYEQEFTYTYI